MGHSELDPQETNWFLKCKNEELVMYFYEEILQNMLGSWNPMDPAPLTKDVY